MRSSMREELQTDHGRSRQGCNPPMLALTRRIGEEVVIGDPANPLGVVRVVEIHGDKVRLAFDFPRDMQINRKELAEQKLRDQASG